MCFPVSVAGFFAKSQIVFFLPSSVRFCPPLKNDGRGERFCMVLTDFYLREEEYKMQPVPGHGEGGGVSRRKGHV